MAGGPAKAAGALRTIGELSAETGIAAHILRYWEKQVPALQPLRRAGRRYYRTEDVALIRRLHELVSKDGYTLEGAARAVRARAKSIEESVVQVDTPVMVAAPATAAAAGHGVDMARIIAVRDRLARALAA